jgi:hypothetical protein
MCVVEARHPCAKLAGFLLPFRLQSALANNQFLILEL